jgi:hypothetical protein
LPYERRYLKGEYLVSSSDVIAPSSGKTTEFRPI